MDMIENRTKRHKAFRKRIRGFLRVPFVAKQFSWRFTAGWIWISAIATVFGFRGHLNGWEDAFFLQLNAALVSFGFTPSNPKFFTICVKLLWLFVICGFSWVQLIGFFLYVPFLPLVLLVRFSFRKRLAPYRKTREEAHKASRKSGSPIPKRTWALPLVFLLVLWLVLYGQTSAPYPLALALLVTALLFCSRVGRALTFAVPAGGNTWDQIEGMSASARKFVANISENLKTGQILEKWILNLTIWVGSFLLKRFRELSRSQYGRTARRRIALIVLLRFMFDLAALGGLSILFWAFAIKFALTPAHVSLLEALLASASRAIPGIPDSSTLRVPAIIQTLDSVTAWMVFVLYAGPVASLFPAFQEQAIARSAENYARLRRERKALYRFLQRLLPLQRIVREHPELAQVAKTALFLKMHTEADVRQAFLSKPETARALASSPVLLDFMRQLGAPIPSLEEFMEKSPSPSVDERTTAEGSHNANQHIAKERESTGESPAMSGKDSL